MVWANEITGLFTVCTMILVAVGLWPHMIRQITSGNSRTPLFWLIMFIMIFEAKTVLRITYWDLGSIIRNHFGWTPWIQPEIHMAIVNGSINIIAFSGTVCGLLALYYSIPEEDRRKWSLITAPFYPNGLRIFPRKD